MVRERIIPSGAVKVADKASDAVLYVYTADDGRPALMAYQGRQSKPAIWVRYRTTERREKAAQDFLESRRAHKVRKAKANAPHKLEEGHMLVCSWGYDQTNVDFYQVTRVVGPHTVEVRKVRSTMVEGDNSFAGKVIPVFHAFTGEPQTHRVSSGDRITLTSYSSASLWNGRPMYVSFYA